MGRLRIDRAALRKAWADPTIPLRQLADEQGVTVASVVSMAKRMGLPPRRDVRPERVPDTPELRARYCDPATNLSALAAELGVHPQTLRKAAVRRGWTLPKGARRRTGAAAQIEDTAALRALWADDSLTLCQVARKVGVTECGLRCAARRFDYPKRKRQKDTSDTGVRAVQPRQPAARVVSGIDADELRLLWGAGCIMEAIAEHLKVCTATLRDHVRALGLPSRAHLTKAGRPGVAEVLARHRAALRVVPKTSAPAADPDPVPRPPGWTEDRDAAVIASGGRYGEINALAARWGIDSSRVLARYHRLRAA